MNIDVKFTAANAIAYTNGPFYVVTVENRYSVPQGPAAGEGNYFPGYFNEFGNFISGWTLDFRRPDGSGRGECTNRFNYSAVPSAFFNYNDIQKPPNASAKFRATAVLPGAQDTEMKVGMAGILNNEPGKNFTCGSNKPAGLFAKVFPTIDPAYSITSIQFRNVTDASGKQTAVDIAFNLRVYASPPQPTGKVQIINSAGKTVKTVASNMTLTAGVNSVRWNLTNDSGGAVPNGIYTALITASADSASVSARRSGLSVQR